jgi:hypothetical protein
VSLPVDLGNIDIYAGAPYTLELVFENKNFTGQTFRSMIRANAGDGAVLAEWTIGTPFLVTDTTTDTHILMTLSGDPAIGTNTGKTRILGPKSVFDVERIVGGVPTETMCKGTILVTQDVTR